MEGNIDPIIYYDENAQQIPGYVDQISEILQQKLALPQIQQQAQVVNNAMSFRQPWTEIKVDVEIECSKGYFGIETPKHLWQIPWC